MVTIPLEYISMDERGVAYIMGTRIKVRDIAIETTLQGYSPADIQEAHEHLSLSQIHAALAYYYSHREQIDAEIAAADRTAEQMRAQIPQQVTRAELEARLKQRKTDPSAT